MNACTPYEITIAQKLQQLPVPDMADAIWSRIERQLDIDLPTNEGGGTAPDVPTGSGWLAGGLMIALTALVAVFLLYKKPQQPTPAPAATPDAPKTVVTLPVPQGQPPPQKTTPRPGAQANATLVFTKPDSAATAVLQPLPAAAQPDSHATVQAPLPAPAAADTAQQKRGGRGVKGIGDADYRIVPKKDSSREP